ncbi:peptidoglycan-binding domain-containing protein [Actinophytocola glycyrrhizae]|uniref:Peptidoglycan-binding protein n=1 Tax=Actinophytocola glycyrrhizae TaxID=2044873 RepID=A0ABV9S8G1_9PSEU
MRRVLAMVAVTAALVTGGISLTGATASAASSVGWCDGVKAVKVNARGDYVRQPYHRGTGSRNCTLAEGAQGGAVVVLQTALKSCNYASNLGIDGDFGPNTKKAVAYAQYRWRIGQDGIYGPESRRAFAWPMYFAGNNPSGKCLHVG